MNFKFFLIVLFSFLLRESLTSQNSSFDGFNYQALLLDPVGTPYINASLQLKAEIRLGQATGAIIYDEVHNVVSSTKGYCNFVVGNGTPLSGGSTQFFKLINWTDTSYYFNLYLYDNGSGLYQVVTQKRINASVFSLYSKNTAQKFAISDMIDVDTAGIQNQSVLKWNGSKWVIGSDNLASDTVLYAQSSGTSLYADTAYYALNAQNILPSDTANFAYNAQNSQFANFASHSNHSDSSTYATNAGVAQVALNTWKLTGNLGTNPSINFIGSQDANDVLIKTNDTTRMVIKQTGRIGIGTTAPTTDFHVLGNNGFVFNGTFGSGIIPMTGAGTRVMWYPKKAAFRGGSLDAGFAAVYWDDNRIGNYSFAYGRNVEASGISSMAMGEDNHSLGNYSGAIGSGNSVFGGGIYSFAAGHGNQIFSQVSFALGRGNVCRGIASGAFGYHSEANGDYSRSFGFYTYADGDYSTSMGYQCKALNNGSFIFCDYSNIPAYLNTTADNQFMVKAAGGFVFYTNSTSTVGAALAAGSGSWSTLSDSTKKENFKEVNYAQVLEKVSNLNVYEWNYKTQDKSIRHIGPTAQSFYQSFGLGENNTSISSVDIDGVNMAAIKALAVKTSELESVSAELDSALKTIEKLKNEKVEIEKRLSRIESSLELYSDNHK